jgi:hypothetical protein
LIVSIRCSYKVIERLVDLCLFSFSFSFLCLCLGFAVHKSFGQDELQVVLGVLIMTKQLQNVSVVVVGFHLK